MVIQAVRSLVFFALFYVQTVVLAVFVGLLAITIRRPFDLGLTLAMYWARANTFMLRWIVGIRSEVTGQENLPAGGCIIAAKHQSDWDIYALLPHSGRPAFIAKRELMDIPFFGWAAQALDTIRIDRSLGGKAVPQMIEAARAATGRGCRIIIFPEGTRRPPLSPPHYKVGVSRLYEALNVPVVPVALNSGLFWGRRALVLWPGTARARFLEPIPPGLGAEEMQRRLVAVLEAESDRLAVMAAKEGIARPLSDAMQDRLRLLREQADA
ncbi:MAG: 1-acyl-sn-glycerol-3-phosphate acyltransferase [Alphaproteobacteria bacterium]|nr:1-acyl-sn-glycerol-3-phosphate acyltransferase [Alphaproteobacteria bacterium]